MFEKKIVFLCHILMLSHFINVMELFINQVNNTKCSSKYVAVKSDAVVK